MNEIVQLPLDAATAHAARLFVTSASRQFAVRRAVLFGSRARNDFRPDSDADVAMLMDGPRRPFLPLKLELADIAYEVLLETGIRIQPLPLWPEEWDHPETFSNPQLLDVIRREGVPL